MPVEEGDSFGESNRIIVSDPAMSLLQVGKQTFLALLMISSLKQNEWLMASISTQELQNPNLKISCQLLSLQPQPPTTVGNEIYD